MNGTKFTLAAIALAAMAISLASCGGSKPPAVEDGFTDVTTPADELQKMCKNELKDYLCGIGENTSTNEQIAKDVAAANARRELASKIQVSLDAALKRTFNNTFNEEGRETTLGKVQEEVEGTFSNIDIHEIKTQFNKKEGKYKKYVLVTVKRSEIASVAQNKLSNAQVLSDAAASKIFSEMIEEELKKR
jgi:hypothetical protein